METMERGMVGEEAGRPIMMHWRMEIQEKREMENLQQSCSVKQQPMVSGCISLWGTTKNSPPALAAMVTSG